MVNEDGCGDLILRYQASIKEQKPANLLESIDGYCKSIFIPTFYIKQAPIGTQVYWTSS